MLLVAAGAILTAAILVFVLRRFPAAKPAGGDVAEKLRQLDAELEALRQAKGESDRGLAVAGSRIPTLEASLREALALVERLRDEKTAAERAHGAAKEALASKSEAALAEARAGKAKVEESLAAKSEAVERLEAAHREVRGRLAAAEDALNTARSEAPELRTELAKVQEALSQERKHTEEKLALLHDAKARLTEQFKVLAEEVMGRHGEAFKQQNKEQLDVLLTPLREQLTGFQAGLQTAHVESSKDRAQLAEQLRALVTTGATMTNETRSLTQALRGEAQTQGAWGEMILYTILQRSGLREGEEYVTQESYSTDEGARLRPDVIVQLPDDKRIVIDSKVSLSAFTDYVSEGDATVKAGHLTRHVASMRGHIRGLSRKEYHRVTGLDFVIMFVPIEGALAAALQDDPALMGFAAEHNVAIGTPTTLMLALRTVANVWHVERRNRNAEEIAERAGKLYDKFVGFIGDMQALGGQLEKARSTYDDALGKLSKGAGNLVRQTEMLRTLGAKAAKALPPMLVADAQAGDSVASMVMLDVPAKAQVEFSIGTTAAGRDASRDSSGAELVHVQPLDREEADHRASMGP
ncbi:MAG: DNA recombination protein RmuC, partial [Polyangiaceae bacterium]